MRATVLLTTLAALAGLALFSSATPARAIEARREGAAGAASAYACTPRQTARPRGSCPQAWSEHRGGVAAAAYPLPTLSVDSSYAFIPFRYKRLSNSAPTPLYTSWEDARAGRNAFREIEPGFSFMSWLDCQIIDGKAIYQVAPGVFMRRGGDCSPIGKSTFPGLHFYRTPQTRFGWVLAGDYSSPAPGEEAAQTTPWLNRYAVVRILDERSFEGATWYQVGDGQWLEEHMLSVETPDRSRPGGVPSQSWISIDLQEQTVSVYQHGELIFSTLVSTGLPGWWTKPGVFQVYSRLEQDDISGAFAADSSDLYLLQDVPRVLYYDHARAMHGAYRHNGYGYPRSHGCVNLSPADARWMFEWTEQGTWVHVFDPSGTTPTEAQFYGKGGA